MGLTSTRTHTRYFDHDQIIVIKEAFNALRKDWLERRPFVDGNIMFYGDARIALLQNAIEVCDEDAL